MGFTGNLSFATMNTFGLVLQKLSEPSVYGSERSIPRRETSASGVDLDSLYLTKTIAS
jgi:hypothetical protein